MCSRRAAAAEAAFLGHRQEVPELAQLHEPTLLLRRRARRAGAPIAETSDPVEFSVTVTAGLDRFRAVLLCTRMRRRPVGERHRCRADAAIPGDRWSRRASLELAEIADSTGPLSERAQEMLERLRRLVPFDAAWLALADPMGSGYTSLASTDLDERTLQYLSGPEDGARHRGDPPDRGRPPLSPSDLPYPAAELPTWAECFIPAGFHEALGVALFDAGQRHVGHLALLSGSRSPVPGHAAPAAAAHARAGARGRPVALR